MARKNTPNRVYELYIDPLEKALGCIAFERLSVMRTHRFEAGPVYAVVLNGGDPVLLRGATDIRFSAGQAFRIIEDPAIVMGRIASNRSSTGMKSRVQPGKRS